MKDIFNNKSVFFKGVIFIRFLVFITIFIFLNNFALGAQFIPKISDNDEFIKNNELIKNNTEESLDSGGVNIETSLSYYPTIPINDPYDTNEFSKGDTVFISAGINDKQKSEYIYKWSIEASGDNTDNPKNGFWKDVSDFFEDKSAVYGKNADNFDFKLNLSESKLKDIFGYSDKSAYYLRVKLEVSEKKDEKYDSRKGKGFAVIKFSNNKDIIIASLAGLGSDGKLDFDDNNRMCLEKGGEVNECMATGEELVSMMINNENGKYSDFKWKIDNNDVICDQLVTATCKGGYFTNTIFFPIIGTVGDRINVSVEMLDSENGKIKNVNKTIVIVKPSIQIVSADSDLAWNKNINDPLINLERIGKRNVISNIFQSYKGSVASLEVYSEPSWIAVASKKEWRLNGNSLKEYDDIKKISIPIDKSEGTIYNLNIKTRYSMPEPIRMIYENVWGATSVTKNISGIIDADNEIQIEILRNKKIKESVFSNPKMFVGSFLKGFFTEKGFLLKIIITSIIILAFAGVTHHLTLESIKNK